jgi:energy-coupling factor transporter ATP-binding protein EcfA2
MWWQERAGLKENPFDITNYTNEVIGAEEVENVLISWLKSGKRMGLLFGPTGTGKTNLIRTLKAKIDRNEIESLCGHRTICYSCDEYAPSTLKWALFKNRFWGNKPLIAFIDESNIAEVSLLNHVWRQVENGKLKGAIMVQINEKIKEEKLGRLARRIGVFKQRMTSLTKDQICEIIKRRQVAYQIKALEDDAIRHIIGICRANPSNALQYCDLIAEELYNPKQPITLEQTKEFKFIKEPKLVSGESEESLFQNNPLEQSDDNRFSDLSTLSRKVIAVLRINSMTSKEIAKETGIKYGTVRKLLQRLKQDCKVMIKDNSRPKYYGLDPAYEQQIIID